MSRRPTREPLNPARVVAAAVAVADRGGVGALSMRKVAEELGVEAMALYYHLPNKDALVDRAVDAVFAELHAPPPGQGWEEAIEARCWSMYRVVSRHSWVLGLIESRDHVGPARLRHLDAVLGVLVGGGFSALGALQAVSLLDSYVYGFVLQERQQLIDSAADTERAAAELLGELSEDELPHLRAIASRVLQGPAPSHEEAFGRGLRVIIGALAATRQP